LGGGASAYLQNYGVLQRVSRLTRHLELQDRSRAPVRRAAYQPHTLSRRLSDETVAAILAAYKAGATTREVGERFGVAHSSVNKLLRQHGGVIRRRGPRPTEVERSGSAPRGR
jgi:transposase-like protein